jgi:hypothetical protein
MLEFTDYTYMRFEVELSFLGFPDDEGEALAKEVKQALLDAAKDFDADVTIKETTE